ncbi:sensor histidine kinase [Lysobacter sp. D1-1-M9]|uniref:sensor histidine kinase n=1 Tax=Novilysobacter longmucuonensis TaxID=3098603 RepID=UPI002FCB65F9
MSRPRTAWMNRLAHDLRGPLSPMQTAVFLLRDDRVEPPERTELLDIVDRQTRRLGGMIDEIGDWVRAEQGRLISRREDIEVAMLLDEIAPRLGGAAPQVRFAPGTEASQLNGDALRLGQLLRTVLGFRFKRGEQAPAQVEVEPGGLGRVRLRRRLDCPYQARDQAGILLEEPLPEPLDEGLGLGLLVARAIAEAHDGQLRAHAPDGDTIELILELPLAGKSPG